VVEQVYIHVDYILELLKVVLTNIMMVKIRYLGKIVEFCLQLVLFSEFLLKIPDGFSGIFGWERYIFMFLPCLTPKSVQTCSIHSPDGDCKVSLKKIDPFMTNGCRIVAPAEVTSD
jgi:hypothetical protein